MEGRQIVTSDDTRLGEVIAERDGCVIIETGHLLKAKHAIPQDFLHERDGELYATVAKDVVSGSPKVDIEDFDSAAVRRHYGLDVDFAGDQDET